MKIHVRTPLTPVLDFDKQLADDLRRDLRGDPAPLYEVTESPSDADLVVFVESVIVKKRRDVPTMLADSVIRQFPEKCVTINYEDTPPGFLPGIYSSLPARRFDHRRHRSWGYPFADEYFLPFYDRRHDVDPSLLFSFRGSLSHRVRKWMLRDIRTSERHEMTRVYGWYDHSDQEKEAYITQVMNSQFVLCPRGIGTCSHRLFEVMAMARCPVIISDSWVPPPDIPWDTIALRVAEKEVAKIPAILLAEREQAAERGRAARVVWEQFFSPSVRARAAIDQLMTLTSEYPITDDYLTYKKRWDSWSFARENGWTMSQRAAASAETNLRKGKQTVRRVERFLRTRVGK